MYQPSLPFGPLIRLLRGVMVGSDVCAGKLHRGSALWQIMHDHYEDQSCLTHRQIVIQVYSCTFPISSHGRIINSEA